MIGHLALFLFSLLLIWGSSDLITRKITPLARALGVKELTITVLGVSVLSSLPELTVSTFAVARGSGDISIGNVIGSNFVTLTFVTAVCALFRPIDIHREVRARESSWMILSSSLVLILSMDGKLSRSDGFILVATYMPYVVNVIRTAMEERRPGKSRPERPRKGIPGLVGLAALGVLGVVAGARLALDSGTSLGEAVGIPTVALGVVLFAFGTSLPELAISLSATFKHKSDVTIGEVYASNIFTQLVVLGICCLIAPMAVPHAMTAFAMPFLVLAAVVIQLFVTSGHRLCRMEAVGLLIFYAVFAVSQFVELPSIESMVGF
ncbi:calcium/sodium antiporter [Candidatus Fermentibacterales bacterium]|nr:calcium/sodium antiporter [Candidatus Fermentibacterales bacterium]